MADVVTKIKVTADSSQAEASMERLGSKTSTSMTAAAAKVAVLSAAIGAAVYAAKALGDVAAQGVRDFMDYERTTVQLTAALSATGNEVSRNTAYLQRQSGALEALIAVSDEEIRRLQIKALMYGTTVDRIDDTIRAAFSLAKVTGQDVNSAFEALSRTQQGTIDRTLKNISAVNSLTEAELRAGGAIDAINGSLGRLLAIDMDTFGGKLDKLKTSMSNFAESLAAEFLQNSVYIKGTLIMAQEAMDWLNSTMAHNQAPAAGAPKLQPQFDFAGMGGDFQLGRKPTGPGFEIGGPEMGGPAMEFGILNPFPGKTPEEVIELTQQHAADLQAIETGYWDLRDEAASRRYKQLESDNKAHNDELKRQNDEANEAKRKADERAAAEERARLYEQQQARKMLIDSGAQYATQVTQTMTDMALSALEQWEAGEEVAWAQMTFGALRGMGKQLLGAGISHGFQAAAMAITSVGANPQAYAMAGLAAAEVAAGAAMIGGSIPLGAAARAQSAAMGGAGGSGSGGAVGAGIPGQGTQVGGEIVGREITINVGGVMTSRDAGREIVAAVEQAARRGRL